MPICKHCNKDYTRAEKDYRSIFCSKKCLDNWYYHNNQKFRERVRKASKIYQEKLRQDPERVAKKKAYFELWRKDNREVFNETVRLSMKRRRDRFLKLGLCTVCGERKPRENYLDCVPCAVKSREKNRKRYLRLQAQRRSPNT